MCRTIPWESYQGLRSLSLRIVYQTVLSKEALEAEAQDTSPSIFLGPSRLPHLEDLGVSYYNNNICPDEKFTHASLDLVFVHNLNRTIEGPTAFPSLQTLRVAVAQSDMVPFLPDEQFVQLVVERLPAVFGVGGRREVHGWNTSVVANVPLGYWSYYV